MEIPELSALYGKNSDAIKSFISTRQDEVRLAYQVEKGYYPRQCIFVGTTNNMDFLSDTTGNRRFWPVVARKQKMTKSIKDDLPAEVDQIWAEAVQIFKAGEPLYLEDPKLEAIANAIQEQHRERDAWEDVIAEFLEKPAPPDYWENPDSTGELCKEDTTNWVLRDKVTISQLWRQALGEFKMNDTIPAKRIRNIMRSFDSWEDALMSENGKTVRGFKRLKK
jgi:predicted P-loop ATPase